MYVRFDFDFETVCCGKNPSINRHDDWVSNRFQVKKIVLLDGIILLSNGKGSEKFVIFIMGCYTVYK